MAFTGIKPPLRLYCVHRKNEVEKGHAGYLLYLAPDQFTKKRTCKRDPAFKVQHDRAFSQKGHNPNLRLVEVLGTNATSVEKLLLSVD